MNYFEQHALEQPDLVSTNEIAERFGVRPATVHMWRQRDIDFPEPEWQLKIGPVWHWETIQRWGIQTRRFGK